MIDERNVLDVVATVTDAPACFFEGTLFVETQDSKLALQIFNALCDRVTSAIAYGKCGSVDTSYDFI